MVKHKPINVEAIQQYLSGILQSKDDLKTLKKSSKVWRDMATYNLRNLLKVKDERTIDRYAIRCYVLYRKHLKTITKYCCGEKSSDNHVFENVQDVDGLINDNEEYSISGNGEMDDNDLPDMTEKIENHVTNDDNDNASNECMEFSQKSYDLSILHTVSITLVMLLIIPTVDLINNFFTSHWYMAHRWTMKSSFLHALNGNVFRKNMKFVAQK